MANWNGNDHDSPVQRTRVVFDAFSFRSGSENVLNSLPKCTGRSNIHDILEYHTFSAEIQNMFSRQIMFPRNDWGHSHGVRHIFVGPPWGSGAARGRQNHVLVTFAIVQPYSKNRPRT